LLVLVVNSNCCFANNIYILTIKNWNIFFTWSAERRCDGLAVFVKEENKRLRGPFEVDIYTNLTLDECQALCLRAEKYFCRSVEFDEQTRQCVISEEDSVSQKDDIGVSSSPTHHFYDLVCLDNREYMQNFNINFQH